ncbi:hypothetical protein [Sphaerisporangium corydalis]|uniref:Uncharacterized protein n=1 Tax=Sphaerisporangium corydalis TaxID=1441875 RepID=A0ABV9E828_9ACTN|nr:hypothetical protein [Sphaerisporangium corydalis]
MESYRRDTDGEPLRDPETGEVLRDPETGEVVQGQDADGVARDPETGEAVHGRDTGDVVLNPETGDVVHGPDERDVLHGTNDGDVVHGSDERDVARGTDDGDVLRDPDTGAVVHGQDTDAVVHGQDTGGVLGSPGGERPGFGRPGFGRDDLNHADPDDAAARERDENGVGGLTATPDVAHTSGTLGSPDASEPIHAADPLHSAERDDLRDDLSDGDERDGAAERVKADEQSDLIVYPEEADYPTRSSDDSSLTAGVPGLEPEPVLATNDHHNDVLATNDHDVPGTTTGEDAGSIDYQQRWREVQAGFVDDPRDAVEQADQLVEEAVTALTTRRQALVDRWKNSDHGDTEQLRLALRDYRSLLQELVGLSYATPGHESFSARNETR